MLELRKATEKDLEAVLAFYTRMIDEMAGTDYDVLWKHDEHPAHDFLRESVKNGYSYIGIAEDGNIACGMVIDHGQASGYEKVDWEIDAPIEEVGIIHSVATLGAYHGRGFATQLMQFAIDSSRAEGLKALRLDAFTDNERAHGLYEKLGFVNHGSHPIYYDDLGTIELDMFEKVL